MSGEGASERRKSNEDPLRIPLRTESQQRGRLHAHVLVWLKRKRAPPGWEPLQPVPKLGNSTCQKQRPSTQTVPALKPEEAQEDTLYQLSEAGRVSAEMVRPDVSGPSWGGYADVSKLRIAALARSIQYRIPYLHSCTPAYCLKDRSSCRPLEKERARHIIRTPGAVIICG